MAERFGILCSATDWTGPARTAWSLTKHGAEVCVVAPPDAYVARSKHKFADLLMPFEDIDRHMPSVVRTLAEEFGAHSVLAGDDLAFASLAKLVQRMDGLQLSDTVKAMMARSMPNAAAAKLLASDSDFIVAQQDARLCPAPPCVANPSLVEAEAFAARVGYPVVMKRDGFASGAGVAVCHDAAQLQKALTFTPTHPRNATFVVQKFIRGTVYGATVSGVTGRPLAGFAFVKHECSTMNGATSVAKLDNREEILRKSFELFEMYGLNGYAGFDYVVGDDGKTYFIEVNPRIMPTGHFTQDMFGVDLTAAMLAALRNQPVPRPVAAKQEYVALFPNEWARDVDSPHLRSALHDIPWADPPVFAAMIDNTLKQRTRLEQVGYLSY